MTIKSKISIAVFVLFLLFVFALLECQRAVYKKFYKLPLTGKVVSATAAEKGFYHIRFLVGDKTGEISLSYNENRLRVYSGDSIYKRANSGIVYVKKYEDSVFVKLDLGSVSSN